MAEDIFADIPKEGGNPFPDELGGKGKETPTDSQPEPNQPETPPSPQGGEGEPSNIEDENNIPFHKHPRWKEMIEEKDNLIQENEGLKNAVAELQEFKERLEKVNQQTPETVQVPDWWVRLYGTDEPAVEVGRQYVAWMNAKEAEITDKVISRIKEEEAKKASEQQQISDYWKNYIAKEIASLKAEGKEFDQDKLIDVASRHRPVDDNGNISLRKAYDILALEEAANKSNPTKKARFRRDKEKDRY